MAKKDNNPPVPQCGNMDMELLRRQMKRLEDALTEIKNDMANVATKISAPVMLPATPEPMEMPEIKIPDNLAKSEDVTTLTGIIQTMNGSMALIVQSMAELKKAFEAIPKPEDKTDEIVKKASEVFVSKVTSNLTPIIEKGHTESYYNGRKQYDGISVKDAADIYYQINGLRTDEDLKEKLAKRDKKIKILSFVIIGLVDIIFGLGYWIHSVKVENRELTNIEWLYRAQRAISNDSKFIDRIEKDMLGTDEAEKDGWKDLIVTRESTGPEFNFFYPHDDWQSKKKEESPQEVDPAQSESKPDEIPMPHKSPTRYTPGEIEAIKQMRANPHIPDDAKPSLPEGYEY